MWVGGEIQGAVGWRGPYRLREINQEAYIMGILVMRGWEDAAQEAEKLGFLHTAEYFRKMAAEKAFVPQSVLWP